MTIEKNKPNDHFSDLKIEPDYRHDAEGIWLSTMPASKVQDKNSREKKPVWRRLTNFTAKIVKQLEFLDGLSTDIEFEIEVRVRRKDQAAGDVIKTISVTAAEFIDMNWPEKLIGAEAIVYEGYGNRGHVRAAIQLESGAIPKHVVFNHLGWENLDGRDGFLTAGGAIFSNQPPTSDANGGDRSTPNCKSILELSVGGAIGAIKQGAYSYEVRVPSPLSKFHLPDPPSGVDLVAAIQASLRCLDLAPDHIVYPLYAATWRAPVGNAELSVHLVGPTTVGKSEIAARAQQHFGSGMDKKNLPGQWSSTANYTERLAHLAKDVVLTVDDLLLQGGQSDVSRANREVNRLLRAQANGAGRGRSTGSGDLREGLPPRGLIISTGEDVPDGESLNTRFLNLEVAANDVNWSAMAECQELGEQGEFARAMAGYVQHLAGSLAATKLTVKRRTAELRTWFSVGISNSRLAEVAASLLAGFEQFVMFAEANGAITDNRATEMFQRCYRALALLIARQSRDMAICNPVDLFIESLRSSIITGRCHLTDTVGSAPTVSPLSWGWIERTFRQRKSDQYQSREADQADLEERRRRAAEAPENGDEYEDVTRLVPQGPQIGWWDHSFIYLEPKASLAEAKRFARSCGYELSLTDRTLGKRLAERGLLKKCEHKRHTTRISTASSRPNVYQLEHKDVVPPPGNHAFFLDPDYEGPPPKFGDDLDA
jgi:hypothetical protein